MIFCGCTDRFVSDVVGNPKDQFSHNEAQMPLKDTDGMKNSADLVCLGLSVQKLGNNIKYNFLQIHMVIVSKK